MKRLWPALLFALGCSSAAPARPMAGPRGPAMNVLLWFDTEDYLLPASDDAALRLAEFLTKEGIRATFKVVGEKARTLERRGRMDVIDALKKHEIGYHSNFHSVHPTPAQYLSTLGWDEGVEEFLRREGPGYEDVKRIFGQSPGCYGQPGSSWGPQSFGALRKLGIPVYMDDGSHVALDRKPHWFGGILTCFRLQYTLRTGLGGPDDLEKAKKGFAAAREQILAQGGGTVHIYYHPCEWVHLQFWDGVNFANGANPPREEWKLPPQKTAEQTRVAFETFESYMMWLKTFPDVRFLTARDVLALHRDRALEREFTEADLREIAKAVGEEIGFQVRGDHALAPGEIFVLLNGFVLSKTAQRLSSVPFGPSTPVTPLAEPVKTDWSQFTRTAKDVEAYVSRHGRIPPTVWLGSTGVPPEAWTRALAEVALALLDGRKPGTVEVKPARLSTEKYVATDGPNIWGWLFPKGFHAPAMMELARRQAWTIKPAIPQQP